jgi:hypothetical protein
MNETSPKTGLLKLVLGTGSRHVTEAYSSYAPEGIWRSARFGDCKVIRDYYGSGDDLLGWNIFDTHKHFSVDVTERPPGKLLWPEEPSKIGALSNGWIDLYLSPAGFQLLWEAATAFEGQRSVVVSFRFFFKSNVDVLSINEVSLTVPPRRHPAAIEIEKTEKTIQDIFVYTVRSLYWLLMTIGAVAVVGSLLKWHWP